MGAAFQFPVRMFRDAVFAQGQAVPGKNLLNPFEDALSIAFGGPQSEYLAQSVPVQFGCYARISEQPFEL